MTTPITTAEVLDELEQQAEELESVDQDAGVEHRAIALIRSLTEQLQEARKDAALEQAIQRAAGELPEGWEVHICIEKDGGGVELITPFGTTDDFPTSGERLALEVSDAIDAAIAQEGADHE